jgi:hypothetical protein
MRPTLLTTIILMTMIISPILIVSDVFKIPIITILTGIIHSPGAGAIPIIHGIILTLHILDGIHGVGIHGFHGVIVLIAAIPGGGATTAGIHPITATTTTITVLTVITAMKVTGVQGIQTQFMEVVEPALFLKVARTMNQV